VFQPKAEKDVSGGGWKLGLLINFNVPVLKDGIRRRIL
jgi:hypothetical protein